MSTTASAHFLRDGLPLSWSILKFRGGQKIFCGTQSSMNLNIKGSSRGQPLKIFPTVKHNVLKKADDDGDDEVNVEKYHSFEFFGKKETR